MIIAIGAAIAVHAAAFFLLVLMALQGAFEFGTIGIPYPREEEKEEMTIILEPEPIEEKFTPAVPDLQDNEKTQQFVDATALKKTDKRTFGAMFFSDRNTEAASEFLPVPGAYLPLPTQKGVDIPVLALADRAFVDGEDPTDTTQTPTQESAPLTSMEPPPPQESAKEDKADPTDQPPEKVVEKKGTAKVDKSFEFLEDLKAVNKASDAEPVSNLPELAFRDPTDPDKLLEKLSPPKEKQPAAEVRSPKPAEKLPPPSVPAAPPDKKPTLQAESRKNAISGNILKKGSSSVASLETARGRYETQSFSLFKGRLNQLRAKNPERITYSFVELDFYIDASGKPCKLTIPNPGESTAGVQAMVLEAVQKCRFAPPPPDVGEQLINGMYPIKFKVLFH